MANALQAGLQGVDMGADDEQDIRWISRRQAHILRASRASDSPGKRSLIVISA